MVYLVRHAESVYDPNVPEQERILSLEGKRQAKDLIKKLEPLNIEKIYSSSAKRAIDTIAPFAKKAGLKIELIPENRDGKKIEDKAFRSTADFKINIGGLCNALEGKKDKIDHVELKHDIRVRLCVPSEDPQSAFSDISDLNKYLERLGLKVTSLDLEVPSKTGSK